MIHPFTTLDMHYTTSISQRQDEDGNNEEDARFIDASNLFWDIKTFEEKTEIYHLHIK